jgi:hypothetical protein
VNHLIKLVLALTEENVLPCLDAEGAMYALEGLLELENQGWKFIAPSNEEETEP